MNGLCFVEQQSKTEAVSLGVRLTANDKDIGTMLGDMRKPGECENVRIVFCNNEIRAVKRWSPIAFSGIDSISLL